MAIPPSLGTGWPWIFRDDSAWSRRPLRWASLLMSGVRAVPQTIDKMKATAAVLIAQGPRQEGARVKTQFPSASTSIFVLREQLRASGGVVTMGSCSLKLVFSTSGTAV